MLVPIPQFQAKIVVPSTRANRIVLKTLAQMNQIETMPAVQLVSNVQPMDIFQVSLDCNASFLFKRTLN